MTEGLAHAEALMIEGQNDEALSVLLGIAEDAEEYVDRNCPTTDEVQWFSFPTIFERLAYRRVEKDPRELRDVGEPMDRLYGDLALAAVHTGDYDIATNALKQAVRWNPMGCENRLNLADLFRMAGNMQEYLALTYSVFERASDATHLVRAYLTFSEYFLAAGKQNQGGCKQPEKTVNTHIRPPFPKLCPYNDFPAQSRHPAITSNQRSDLQNAQRNDR